MDIRKAAMVTALAGAVGVGAAFVEPHDSGFGYGTPRRRGRPGSKDGMHAARKRRNRARARIAKLSRRRNRA